MYKAASLAGQADYFAAKKDYEKAADFYNDASLVSELNALNSEYLLKAGINYLQTGNKEKAKELFNLVKVNYKTSGFANQVDKYLAQVE